MLAHELTEMKCKMASGAHGLGSITFRSELNVNGIRGSVHSIYIDKAAPGFR